MSLSERWAMTLRGCSRRHCVYICGCDAVVVCRLYFACAGTCRASSNGRSRCRTTLESAHVRSNETTNTHLKYPRWRGLPRSRDLRDWVVGSYMPSEHRQRRSIPVHSVCDNQNHYDQYIVYCHCKQEVRQLFQEPSRLRSSSAMCRALNGTQNDRFQCGADRHKLNGGLALRGVNSSFHASCSWAYRSCDGPE